MVVVNVNNNGEPVPYEYPAPPVPPVPRGPFNHTPHILMSLFTCGAWIPIYLLIWMLR
jgi:hypothetical protein